jgi:hypothetical protein
MRRAVAGLSDAFDAVEAARWAVMEREAGDDIAAGRVRPTFTSAEDLIAHLDA